MDEVTAKFVEITKAYKLSVWLLLRRAPFVHVSPLRLTDPTICENYEKCGPTNGRRRDLMLGFSLPALVRIW